MNLPGNMDIDLRKTRTPPPSSSTGGSRGRGPPIGVGSTNPKSSDSFPACACKALTQVEKTVAFTLYPPTTLANPSQKAAAAANRMRDLQSCLDQDLFCLGPDRRTTRLNPLKELRQLEMICAFFQEKSGVKDSYIFFDAIFCGREGESVPHEARITTLVKTCLLAVQYPDCGGLLTDVASWLQKVGLAKPYGKQIVITLVDEFCAQDTTDLHSYLFPLIDSTPTFAPYFFALSIGNYDLCSEIPIKLLEISGKWMAENSKPLLRPLTDQKSESSSLQKLLVQAIWKLEMLCLISISSTENIYEKLHFGILNFILTLPQLKPDEKVTLITEQQVCSALQKIGDLRSNLGAEKLESALDKLSQVVQCSATSGCFSGSRSALKMKYIEFGLPKHELLEQIFTKAEW